MSGLKIKTKIVRTKPTNVMLMVDDLGHVATFAASNDTDGYMVVTVCAMGAAFLPGEYVSFNAFCNKVEERFDNVMESHTYEVIGRFFAEFENRDRGMSREDYLNGK